jgi:hypothetical protein
MSYGILNLVLKYFHKMDSLHSIRTCLVIIGIYFIFLIGVFYLLQAFRSLDSDFKNKQHLHSRIPGFSLSLRCTEDVVNEHSGKIGISEPIKCGYGAPIVFVSIRVSSLHFSVISHVRENSKNLMPLNMKQN